MPTKTAVTPSGSMYIGVDYYPEHWPRSRWQTDARLMQKAGFNVVRLAEFAWVNMEPTEGSFDFQWLDDAIAILANHGISVILGTPTAVMPAWCVRKYPETMATQKDGSRVTWGVRKNNCFSSGTYRLLSERITRAMANHYKNHKAVIGWQTDNEFGHPVCFCNTCRATFQDYLRNRYKTLDELNRAWGNHFWGHIVQTWGEIQIPNDVNLSNPSAYLDWARFFSYLNVRFQHDQIVILRDLCKKQFVTHNFMGLFKELDYYDLAAELDFVTWDNYPVWNKPEVKYNAARAADVMRGLKAQNFWIMEQSAGPGGWGTMGRNTRPGELRNVSFQQMAHGADGQVWFRWRTCTAGREQYWHGLLGHDGRPLRRYDEAKQTATDYRKVEKEVLGTTVKADVALIYDYPNIWALDTQPSFNGNTYDSAIARYYDALFRAGVNVDMVPTTANFNKYKILLAPALYIMSDALAKRLDQFVKQGGTLLTDLRSAVKDESGLMHTRTLPGLLAPALGIEIQEYEALPKDVTYPLTGAASFEGVFTCGQFVDWVIPKTAQPLVKHDSWHMQPYAAVTRNSYGKGTGWYVGSIAKEPHFYDLLISHILADARITPLITPPPGIEVSLRQSPTKKILFLINHLETLQTVTVPPGKKELLTNTLTKDRLDLEPYGVAVIKL